MWSHSPTWRVGDRLLVLDESTRAILEELANQTAASEGFWVKRLSDIATMALPFAAHGSDADGPSEFSSYPITSTDGGAEVDEKTAVAALGILLARLSGSEVVDIHLREKDPTDDIRSHLVSPLNRLRVYAASDSSLQKIKAALDEELDGARRRGPWLRDLMARHSELQWLPRKKALPGSVWGCLLVLTGYRLRWLK